MFHAGNYWHNKHHQRNFFVQFAKTHGFEPLIAQNWYKLNVSHINKTKVIKTKGGGQERVTKEHLLNYNIQHGNVVLAQYGNSYLAALLALFPDIDGWT